MLASDVSVAAVEWNAGERGAHLQMVEARLPCGVFAVPED